MDNKCPNCGSDIPEEASFCLHCCKPTRVKASNVEIEVFNKKSRLPIICVSAVAILAILGSSIIGMAMKNDEENTTTSSSIPFSEEQIVITKEESTASTTKEKTTNKATTEATTEEATEKTTEEATEESTEATTKKEKSTTKTQTTSISGTFDYEIVDGGMRIITYIGNEATVNVPAKIDGRNVVEIAPKAFANNKYIKRIVFSNSTVMCKIKANCFYNLSNLKDITLPSKVNSASFSKCFSKCPRLESVNISNKYDQTYYQSTDGIVFSNDAIAYYPQGKADSSYSIPSRIKEIQDGAFDGNSHLKKLKFSKREILKCNWKNLFSGLVGLDTIQIYPGTSVDIDGMQYFDGEIIYYE